LVTPADGVAAAACVVRAYGAKAVVLEQASRFPAYDALFRGEARPPWLGPPVERGAVKVFPVIARPECARP
ncbi:MAG: hypothetical protein FJ104_15670, partial [Deltaproteobacteria bacterium]|nr:hypothetical protein [Deltaproteobacteria bacterium]